MPHLQIRVTDDDKAQLAALAKENSMSVSAYVRTKALGRRDTVTKGQRIPKPLNPPPPDPLADVPYGPPGGQPAQPRAIQNGEPVHFPEPPPVEPPAPPDPEDETTVEVLHRVGLLENLDPAEETHLQEPEPATTAARPSPALPSLTPEELGLPTPQQLSSRTGLPKASCERLIKQGRVSIVNGEPVVS